MYVLLWLSVGTSGILMFLTPVKASQSTTDSAEIQVHGTIAPHKITETSNSEWEEVRVPITNNKPSSTTASLPKLGSVNTGGFIGLGLLLVTIFLNCKQKLSAENNKPL